MSHILDALRQAEDERKLGKPVTRSTIAGPLRPVRRRQDRRSLPITIGLIVGAVALLALANWYWSARDTSPPAASPADAPPAGAETAATTLPLLRLPSEVLAPPAEPAAVDRSVALEGEQALPRARVHDAERLQSVDTLYATPQGTAASADAVASAPAIAPQDIFQTQGAAAASTAAPSRETRTSALAGFDEDAPLPTPNALGVDAIDVAVHVHNPDAASRFILVDGRRYNAGDTLPGGVRLEAIESNAIVLRHQGQYMRQFLR